MKKVLIGVVTLILALVVGCSANQTTKSIASSKSVAEPAQSSSISPNLSAEKDLPNGDYKDTGNGNLVIATKGGTSESGKVPVIFLDSKESHSYEIGIHVRDFDGSKLSYVYDDGYLIAKKQYADEDSSIRVKDDRLTEGLHEIEIVQYDTDKPDGKMVTYKSASYEVKSK